MSKGGYGVYMLYWLVFHSQVRWWLCGIDGCKIVSVHCCFELLGICFMIFICVGVCVCNTGEDFNIIQQEIAILSDCKHSNIVGYLGSYLR